MRTSKYLNFKSGNWTCTHVGVAVVSGAFYRGTRERTLYPGHRTYYYIFERPTSDAKADKLIRLNCNEAAKVYRGKITVEEIAKARQAKSEGKFTKKVSYHFYNEKK